MSHRGPVIAETDELKVIQCKPCGFAHLDPIPEDVDAYYRGAFFQHDKPGAVEDFNASWPWWEAVYSDWLTMLEDLTTGRRLLDVGCGHGFFMKVARERGWDVTGVEVSDEARAHAKDTLHLNIQETIGRGTYDVVSGLWFLEHHPNPHHFVNEVQEVMSLGKSLLFLIVPNEWTDAQFRAWSRVGDDYWLHKSHINYFDKASLAWMLGRGGFRPLEWFSTYPMERFLTAGLDYINTPGLGKMAHALIEQREVGQTRAARLSESIERAQWNMGRDMGVIAVA